ncbi:MAG: hypothetical protein U1F66_00290 [bacterium]
MRRLWILLFLLLPALAQARETVLPNHEPYGKVLRRYTKKGEYNNWQDLHTQLIWYATYASDEFREAFREEYAKVYPQGQDQKAQVRAAPFLAKDPEATFFLALYAEKREMAEMGDDKSLQDVNLEVDGRFYKPKLVEKLPTTQFEIYFFHYVNLWFKTYRVVFPFEGLRNREVPFKLHLDGVAGNITLNFKAQKK